MAWSQCTPNMLGHNHFSALNQFQTCIVWSALCFSKDWISHDVLFSAEGHLQLTPKPVVRAGDLVSGGFSSQGTNVGVLNCSVHCRGALDSCLMCQTMQSLPELQKCKFRAHETAWRGQNHAVAVFSSYPVLHIFWSPLGATQLQFQTASHRHPSPSIYLLSQASLHV